MVNAASPIESSEQFLSGGGEMGKLIRSMDWSKTALGPVEAWPQSLRTSVSLCLSSTFPILIAWGPETIQLYNDSYRPICGAKHPASMGQNFRICWETALSVVGDAFTRGQQGEGTYIKDQRMFLDRYGYLEEAFMTFSFAPIRDESGNVGGIFHPITETTEKMLSARRTHSLRELGSQISKAKSIEEICEGTIHRYNDYYLDLPFVLLYQVSADGTSADLRCAAGLPVDTILTPAVIDLEHDSNTSWPLAEAATTRTKVWVHQLTQRFGSYSCAPYDDAPEEALILPIFISGQEEPFGYLVAGVSICRALDNEYGNFYELLVNTYNTALSNVYAYEQEQRRAEALAAIDRSKTAFFSNVSHEFRTPLTLMLGPLEELMQQPLYSDPRYKGNIESAHGNTLRLLRLVNNLLDFSRVEADRVKAMYQPLHLAVLTADLASSFRSIIEKAGMQLHVTCAPLHAPVYADREMWEKIVLNLLSNAFKYTLEGSITVTLEDYPEHARLKVTDTGIGIPAHELPQMFQRFHRVAQNLGRTHEGTGIGLSLVSELTRLHGGTIQVESVEGQGSTFTVIMPFGKKHLPAELVLEQERSIDTAVLKSTFLKEATMLLDDQEVQSSQARSASSVSDQPFVDKDMHILIAEDNNDMRDYLVRLLQPYYTLETARDGAVALEKLGKKIPNLIISDIMMPVMDGKALLTNVKANPLTAATPFIFLSARAGEEARIDGLEAGADDYLIKPFSAKDLLTTVRAQLRKSTARLLAERQLRSLVIQAPVAIAIYKGASHIIDIANDRMLDIWNKRAEDVVNKPLFEAVSELRGQGFEELMSTVYREGKSIVTGEIPVHVIRGDQIEEIYITLALEPLAGEDATIYGVMVVAAEVTDLVTARTSARQIADKLEKKVVQRTRELSESNQELVRINRELEQYIYVASHDLQEPLRKIRIFSSMLNKVAGLPDTAAPLLSKIDSASERIVTLVRDLLEFSQLREPLQPIPLVDLNVVLQQVLVDFELAIAEKHAVVEYDPLPTLAAVPLQMMQLFSNLLSNALKFARKDTPPRITLRVGVPGDVVLAQAHLPAGNGNYVEIAFQDNGIGFDIRYADQIFEIFKRLNGRESYSGSGIGLPICRRIVQNHGGSLIAESEEGKGSTFRIILPEALT